MNWVRIIIFSTTAMLINTCTHQAPRWSDHVTFQLKPKSYKPNPHDESSHLRRKTSESSYQKREIKANTKTTKAPTQSISEQAMQQIILRFQHRNIPAIDVQDDRYVPTEVIEQWGLLIKQVTLYLQSQKQPQIANLHRIRITLEAERQRDVNRYQTFPVKLDQTIYDLRSIITRLIANIVPKKRYELAPGQLVFRWPVKRPMISSFFGQRQDPILHEQRRFHSGIDLAAPSGTMVYASAAGTVIRAGWAGNSGKTVAIQHAHGYVSVYCHMSTILTDIGLQVEAGNPIGLVGKTGRSTGPHLHFEIQLDNRVVDPLEYIEVPITVTVTSQYY